MDLSPELRSRAMDNTPTYRIEMTGPKGNTDRFAWQTKKPNGVPRHTGDGFPGYGKPSDANLKAYVVHFERSTHAGGVNAHIGRQTVQSARIVRQATDAVVATYEAA